MKIKSNIIRYAHWELGLAGAVLAYCLVPASPDPETINSLSDILTTYVTVAGILAGFSSGISNQFVTSVNEKMVELIKNKKQYDSFVKRYRRSTVLNIAGLLIGFTMILLVNLTNCPRLARWEAVITFATGGAGIGAFIASATVSTRLAELSEKLKNTL